MSSAPSLAPVMPLGQAAEHLQVQLRPDLVVQPQFYEGMTHYVIKDPLALEVLPVQDRGVLPAPAVRRQADAPGRQEGVRAEVSAADDLDRGPDAVRRPAPRGGHHPDRQRRAGQGADPPPQEEPLAEGLELPGQHPVHQDPDHRPRAALDPDVSLLPVDLLVRFHRRERHVDARWPSRWSSATGRRSTTSSPTSRASSTGGRS